MIDITPTHKEIGSSISSNTPDTTVICSVVEKHPVSVDVNVHVMLPAEIDVSKPALLIVAIEGSLVVQVPPDIGDKFIDSPIQRLSEEELTSGLAFTNTVSEGSEVHDVVEFVNENIT